MGNKLQITLNKHETPIEYLRRLGNWSNYEYGNIIDTLPTVEACVDFFELLGKYDVEFFQGIMELIAAGADPKPLAEFVVKHGLQNEWTFDVETEQHAKVAQAIAQVQA